MFQDNVQDDDVEMDAISVTSDMKIEADNESDTESEKSDLESDSVNDENNPTTVKYDQGFSYNILSGYNLFSYIDCVCRI